MAFSAIKTFVDGLVLTAAELNAYLSANTDWLKNGIGWMGASDSGDGSRTAAQVLARLAPTIATANVSITSDSTVYTTSLVLPTSGAAVFFHISDTGTGGRDGDYSWVVPRAVLDALTDAPGSGNRTVSSLTLGTHYRQFKLGSGDAYIAKRAGNIMFGINQTTVDPMPLSVWAV